jgi:hypothetical protein
MYKAVAHFTFSSVYSAPHCAHLHPKYGNCSFMQRNHKDLYMRSASGRPRNVNISEPSIDFPSESTASFLSNSKPKSLHGKCRCWGRCPKVREIDLKISEDIATCRAFFFRPRNLQLLKSPYVRHLIRPVERQELDLMPCIIDILSKSRFESAYGFFVAVSSSIK